MPYNSIESISAQPPNMLKLLDLHNDFNNLQYNFKI